MTAKELRQSLRRGSFVIPFLGIQVLAVAAMAVEFKTGYGTGSAEAAGMLNLRMFWSAGPFWSVVAAICLLIMPLAGVMLMRQELEEGNHELLQLTQLNRWKIVVGKFAALWGLSALTFVSLLPYVVVRYLVGGIEWRHEAACAATVLGGSAMVAAGAIGASAFGSPALRGLMLLLFVGSAALGCGVPLGFSHGQTGAFGVIYHLNALAAVFCYVVIGLALARSRLRMTVAAYEVRPSGMIIGLELTAPFVIMMTTAFTAGFAGGLGLAGMGIVALRLDLTPRAPKSLLPPSNVPVPPGPPPQSPP